MSTTLSSQEVFQLLQVVTNVPGDRNRRGIPTLFEGAPSQAKTAYIEHYARMVGLGFTKFLLSQSEASELMGIPVKSAEPVHIPDAPGRKGYHGHVLEYVPQKWAVDMLQKTHGMVFLDELNLADKSTLDAAQTLLTHGELGSFQLSQHTVLLGAQNPPDMVGGTPISPAAASRWLHVAWAPVAVGDFATYLESMPSWYDEVSPQETEVKLMTPQEADDLLKDQWPGMFRFAGKKVAQFLRQVPNLFYKLPPVGDKARQYAWPCSRTWVMFTRVLAGCKIFNTSDRVRILLLQGCVGKEATTAFLEWYRKSDQLPTIEQVLKGEWVPDRKAVDIAHAVHVNLLEWIDKQKDEVLESNIQTLWKLIPLFYRASLPDLASAYQKGLESRKLFLMDRVLLMDIMRQSADIRKAAGLVPIGRKHGA